MTADAYTAAYLALCDAEDAEARAYAAYLATGADYCSPEYDVAFRAWWPLYEARYAAKRALEALPVPQEAQP